MNNLQDKIDSLTVELGTQRRIYARLLDQLTALAEDAKIAESKTPDKQGRRYFAGNVFEINEGTEYDTSILISCTADEAADMTAVCKNIAMNWRGLTENHWNNGHYDCCGITVFPCNIINEIGVDEFNTVSKYLSVVSPEYFE